MPTDKLQILTPIVTSINGQTGDITIATSDLENDSNFATKTYFSGWRLIISKWGNTIHFSPKC